MKTWVWLVVLVALIGACSGSGDGFNGFDGSGDGFNGTTEGGNGDSVGDRIAGIDPCSLLTAEELTAVLGIAPQGEPREPNGGFISCSWRTGTVIVTIADQPRIVLAPGEENCPSPEIGEDSVSCEGRVKFWMDGIHVSISTIDRLTTEQLESLARTIPAKLRT